MDLKQKRIEKSKVQDKINEQNLKGKEKNLKLKKIGLQFETKEVTEINPIETFRSSIQSFNDEMIKIGKGMNINLDQFPFDPITKNRCLEYALGSIADSPTRTSYNTLNSSKEKLRLSKGIEITNNEQNIVIKSGNLRESNNAGFSGSKDIGNEFEDNLKQRSSGIGIRKVYYQPAKVGKEKLENDYLNKELALKALKTKNKNE